MMANTRPPIDNMDTLKYVLDKGASTDIHVYSSATVTKGLKGEELTDMKALKDAGAICFTDDGIPILSADVAREAMKAAHEIGAVLSFHEEDPVYIENNGVNRGIASKHFGLGGSDRQAEISMVKRDIELAIETGARINIQHISTAEAVDLVRQAKAAGHGDHIFAEATPHHMSMTEEDTVSYGNYAKMNPPLRTPSDRDAIIQGLVDGTIDCIATDHAPHTDEEKSLPIDKAPSGIIGLETSLSVSYNTLIHCGYLSPLQLFCKLSLNPARIYGINAGELAIYRTADIVVFDPLRQHFFNKSQSKSFNTPLKNREITGDVIGTICRGRFIYNNMFEKKRKM
jgi:dihydroorotase